MKTTDSKASIDFQVVDDVLDGFGLSTAEKTRIEAKTSELLALDTCLKELRVSTGVLQKDVANAMGVTKSSVAQLEARGLADAKLSTLTRYFAGLGYKLDFALTPIEAWIDISLQELPTWEPPWASQIQWQASSMRIVRSNLFTTSLQQLKATNNDLFVFVAADLRYLIEKRRSALLPQVRFGLAQSQYPGHMGEVRSYPPGQPVFIRTIFAMPVDESMCALLLLGDKNSQAPGAATGNDWYDKAIPLADSLWEKISQNF